MHYLINNQQKVQARIGCHNKEKRLKLANNLMEKAYSICLEHNEYKIGLYCR